MQIHPRWYYDFLKSSSGKYKTQATNSGMQNTQFHLFFSITGLDFLSSPIQVGGRMESWESQSIKNPSHFSVISGVVSTVLLTSGSREETSPLVFPFF